VKSRGCFNISARWHGGKSRGRHGDSATQLLLDFDGPAASQVAPPPHTIAGPAARFALRFAALLESDPGIRFNNVKVAELARDIFPSAAGHARDAYDAAEAGFNLYLKQLGLDLANTPAAIEQLLLLQARLPTQSRRDQHQIEWQQFSTPPAEALVVVRAAALRPGMTVLEPSAGTGNIAVLARLLGAAVETNEIDERRRELLQLQGFEPTALDAERLDNLLPAGKYFDCVVMNPPFSATGGRVAAHSSAFGARHIEQALLRLKPGGRLVTIVSCGLALERPTFRNWWIALGDRYRVRANVGINGRAYAKFGTTFDHQILVIDHDGPTGNWSDVVTATGLSITAAYELLKKLSEGMSMGEFAKWTKLEATAALQRISGQGPTPGMNPVVELIGCLLEDGSGGIDAPANSPITTEAWLIWNGLALEWPTELAELIETVL
jgi:hypothetical protein